MVQLPHQWVIGADSKETLWDGSSKQVNKILTVGKFIVLRFGSESKLGDSTFDFDMALRAALKEKNSQREAFQAAKETFEVLQQVAKK